MTDPSLAEVKTAAVTATVAPEPKKTDYKIAYISAGSALLGALVGAVASFGIAMYGSQRQDQTDTKDFIRAQRQVAYSKAILDRSKLNSLQLGCVSTAENSLVVRKPSKADIQVAHARILKARMAMENVVTSERQDWSSIELIGSPGSFGAFNSLIEDDEGVTKYCTLAQALQYDVTAHPSLESNLIAVKGYLEKSFKQQGVDSDQFVKQTRGDLGLH